MLISTLSLLSGGTAHALPRRALRCGRLLARGLAHAIRVFCLCRAVRCALGLAVCGAALALSACSKGGAGDGALTLYGNVDIRQIALAFEGSGRVLEMAVDEGARVQAGQTLALQAAQARAQIEAQRQSLRKLESGTRPQEVAQAQSRVAAARADAARARQDLARLRQLASGGAASRQALEHAQTAAQVAEAKVRETQEALRLAQIGPREEDIAAARAQLKAAEAALALLEHQIEQGALRAPVSAVVRARLLEPGDMASPQRPAYTLALAQPKWVRVYVAEPDLGRVAPGMPAAVTTDSQPDQPLRGTVGYIASVAEFTPRQVQTAELRTSLVYEVRVQVDDPADALRLGQPATVRLQGAPAAGQPARAPAGGQP